MLVTIVSHANANSGAIDRYEDYLKAEGHTISKLTHPLDIYKNGYSKFIANGKTIWSRPRKERGAINLLLDFKLNIQTVRKIKSDVIIGANNFDTYSVIFAKRFFRNRAKIIYFASDYSENRFGSGLMNVLYGRMERATLKGADLVVSNTNRAESKRIQLGLQKSKSVVVFNTAHISNPKFPNKKIDKKKFVYAGSLTKEHGLYGFLQECSALVHTLDIIGDGPERANILKLCKEHDIKVTYHGQKPHDWLINFLQKFAGWGLAPYNLQAAQYVYYGSSLKIYEYIACGLPVITSNVTEQSELVAKSKLGLTYKRLSVNTIGPSINAFPILNFNFRAKEFYNKYNQTVFYWKILL